MSFDTKFIEFCIVFQWFLNHIKFIFTIVLFFIKKNNYYRLICIAKVHRQEDISIDDKNICNYNFNLLLYVAD